ncbi:hypothetical protein X956_03945 [Trueperella pyogenes TP8]|nr:hypothetical protein X956_03945 [Trueperella pyogenes TP8]
MELASVLIAAASALVALVAIGVALRANKIAQDGNEIAQRAQGAAVEANRLAVQANEIAGDANLIAQRSVDIAEDQADYVWVVKFDHDQSVAVVRNDSSFSARDVTVVVRLKDSTAGQGRIDKLPGFNEFEFPVDGVLQALAKQHPAGVYSSNGITVIQSRPAVSLTAWISWLSELGVRRSCSLEFHASDSKRGRGKIW